MKDFENVMLMVLNGKPLPSRQSDFVKNLLLSSMPFERLVGQLAMQITKKTLRSERVHDSMKDHVPEVLFRLFNTRSSKIIRNSRIKNFVFDAAMSRKAPDRINATQVLAKIAKRERAAHILLRKLKKDENEIVRHNAKIFLSKLPSRNSSLVAS